MTTTFLEVNLCKFLWNQKKLNFRSNKKVENLEFLRQKFCNFFFFRNFSIYLLFERKEQVLIFLSVLVEIKLFDVIFKNMVMKNDLMSSCIL